MGVTVYSVIISVLLYNLSLIVIFLLRRSRVTRAKNTSGLLLFLTLLGVVRLLTPIDFDKAFIIHSSRVLPTIEDTLTAPLLGPLSLGRMLLILWAAGILMFVLLDLLRQRRFLLAEKNLPLIENKQINSIAAEFGGGFTLKVSPEIELPYVSGLFRPVIYLPDVMRNGGTSFDMKRSTSKQAMSGRKCFFGQFAFSSGGTRWYIYRRRIWIF